MADSFTIELPDEQATLAIGARLSGMKGLIFLHGELGAGKTTFVRGYLQGLGYEGAVKSPTYTLIEPYDIAGRRLLHLDIYRLADPIELENIGVRDDLGQDATLLVEWAERAHGYLGLPDLDIYLEYAGDSRQIRIQPADDKLAEHLAQVIPEHQ